MSGVTDAVAAGFRKIISGDPTGAPPWVHEMADGVDAGYFGPGSATWIVHGGLPTIVGGIRALLMQALHPGALAGVMQHSQYQDDAHGRLARTTQWLTVVTFGDTVAADRQCARVRGLHRTVKGTYDVHGMQQAYTAMDPDLLRWVHVAFTDSFLTTHRTWGGPIPGGEDAYVAQWATSAELIGVTDPPRTVRELRQQIAAYEPVLRGDAATRQTVRFIAGVPMPLAARAPYALLFAGAASTLPAHYRRMLGLPSVPGPLIRPAVAALLGGLGLALGKSSPSEQAARTRIARLALVGADLTE